MNRSNSLEEKRLPIESQVGSPVLRVKDLDHMLAFYQGVLGLQASGKNTVDDSVELGFFDNREKRLNHPNGPLLVLKHDPKAKDGPRNFAGLFHFAILVPDRKSLAHAYLGVKRNGVRFDGFGDHLVSESLYLHDPEGNGIEIYRDRPRNEWTHDNKGHVVMDTLPLDLDGILGELVPQGETQEISETFPKGARIGHMHLRVTNLEKSTKFYHDKLGFDISADWSSMGAMFLSAGAYHHHIGMNTWHSLGGERREPGEEGLDEFMIEMPYDPHFMRDLELRLEGSPFTKLSEHEILVSDPDSIPVMIKSI